MGSKFYLEQEIFVEILIRTTLETLDTFKVASKEYNELASESWFIEKYFYVVFPRWHEDDTIFSNQPPVCIGGIVYLLTNRNTFLAFDSKTETHREFPSPIAAIEDDKNYSKGRIVDYKGKLGFTCEYKSDEVWLWGVEDNRDYRWEIKRVVRIDKENNRLIGCSLADMALMIGYSYQVSGSHYYKDIFPFRSDWEPVDLEDGCMLSGLEELITAISSDDD
nr:F-box protein At5g49610-like [Ipomoea trifida]